MLPILDSRGTTIIYQDTLDLSPELHRQIAAFTRRSKECPGRAMSPAAPLACLAEANTLLFVTIEVRIVGNARLLSGIDESGIEGVVDPDPADTQRPRKSAVAALTHFAGLDTAKIG